MLRSVWRAAHRIRQAPKWSKQIVSLSHCVNYNAFLYGPDVYNPLQDYLFGIQKGTIQQTRRAFIEFLQFYRPTTAAQALGINAQDKDYPLFLFPWDGFGANEFRSLRTWRDEPQDCPDILTHFSERGVLSFRIEEEWIWAERALYSLGTLGYKPDEMGFLRARTLVKSNGERRYLLVDGNHRAAAMTVLGWPSVELEVDERRTVRESEVENWPGVRQGLFSREASLALLDAYFVGNSRPRTSSEAAPLLAPSGWENLYL